MAARPSVTAIARGVAKASAHGQATMSRDVALAVATSIPCESQAKKATTARSVTTTTKHASDAVGQLNDRGPPHHRRFDGFHDLADSAFRSDRLDANIDGTRQVDRPRRDLILRAGFDRDTFTGQQRPIDHRFPFDNSAINGKALADVDPDDLARRQ